MSAVRVLIVDDEPQIRRFLTLTLEANGYVVTTTEDGSTALALLPDWRPDLILLDLGLPGLDGLEVLRRVRTWSPLPIIVLSVRDREADKVAALNLGADDYLTKPFGTGELLARIQVALRHAARTVEGQGGALRAGDLLLDLAGHRVTRRGEELHLTPTEFAILRVLARQSGRVVTPSALLREVWGEHGAPETAKLRVFINQLRRKIEDDPAQPRYVLTEPGVGYRFDPGAGGDLPG
jgi:two-component system KDP operon response regulator KdpE